VKVVVAVMVSTVVEKDVKNSSVEIVAIDTVLAL
jgi:hypothetical protein